MPNKYAFCIGFSDEYSGKGYVRLPFAYKNVLDLTHKLQTKGYTVFPRIPESEANKGKIKALLLEKISTLKADDWLLFYYVGHGDIKLNPNSINNVTTYLVTSFNAFDSTLGVFNFFTDDDYAFIINAFKSKAPEGHLITILDCCYAFGLVDTFYQQRDFHTIIAASTYDRKAFCDTNSIFFKGLSVVWDLTLLNMTTQLDRIVKSLNSTSRCQSQVAGKFNNLTF